MTKFRDKVSNNGQSNLDQMAHNDIHDQNLS